jgi:hypothetical protein
MNKMRWSLLCLLAVAALVGVSVLDSVGHPAPVAAQSQGVELAVYNQGFALVKDLRALDLTQGLNEVRFSDVASQIDPTSVHFRSVDDPEGTVVLEQNYEYDVVGSAKLLQKYVDKEIRVVTNDGKEYTGTLLNGDGDVILQTAEGQIRVLKLEQIKEFEFPALPEGLITQPTLVWQLQASKAGSQDVEVDYMTNGINWQATYVVILADDEKSLDLNGWVTLDNRSGASYEDAKLKLVAGDVNRVSTPSPAGEVYAKVDLSAPSAQVEERAFFEYHLYEVQRPVTVKDQQTKQIEFITANGVPATKFFVYDGSRQSYYAVNQPIADSSYGTYSGSKVAVNIEFENSEEAGLGLPLPAGIMRVSKRDTDGSTLLVGEDAIDHTPKDEKVRLNVGDAFDIVGERKQTNYQSNIDHHWIEESFEITLRNHKEEAVEVRVVEHMYRWSEWTITESSEDYEKLDAQAIEYRVQVPANGEAKVTYSVKYEW